MARYSQLAPLSLDMRITLASALGPEFIHYLYGQATVQLTGTTKLGDAHAGTAIVISPTWLLTCGHVLTDMTLDASQDHRQHRFSVTQTLVHPHIDMGLVEITPPIAPLPGLSFRRPTIAETVFTLGYPRVPLSAAATLIMQRGEVTAEMLKTIHGKQVFLFSAIARPGNSGGPVLSADGQVLGIVTEELFERTDGAPLPFHAGICADTLRHAMIDLGAGVELPFETYE